MTIRIIGGWSSKFRNDFKDGDLRIETICNKCNKEVLITPNQMMLKKNFPKMDIWCSDCINEYKGEFDTEEVSDGYGNYAVDERKLREGN